MAWDGRTQAEGKWSSTQTSSANTAQTLSVAAIAGKRHYVTGLVVAIKAAAATGDINVVLKDGTTALWSEVIGDSAARGTRVGGIFDDPFEGTVSTAINLVVDAGGASCVTVASIKGYYR